MQPETETTYQPFLPEGAPKTFAILRFDALNQTGVVEFVSDQGSEVIEYLAALRAQVQKPESFMGASHAIFAPYILVEDEDHLHGI